jgi:ABC-2 type transport system ATP-binding protein
MTTEVRGATQTQRPLAVEVDGLWKRYGERDVVRDVSFGVAQGELLGFVGPNGSGKTTTIRMILDILPPTRGNVRLFGAEMTEDAQKRIGYLPEERGLYQGQRVWPTLLYLAELKGMSHDAAEERAEAVLRRVGMFEHRHKKVRELSRGMGQLVQFSAAVMHRPAFIVLDEPFSGLDPVNTRLMKEIMVELAAQGTSIMFSTHQMTDVEEMCEKVVMINQGSVVLDGGVDEVKRRFSENAYYVEVQGQFGDLPSALSIKPRNRGTLITLRPEASPDVLLRDLMNAGVRIERFEVAMPSLEEIFIRIVGANRV